MITVTVQGLPRAQPRARFIPGRARPVSTASPAVKLYRAQVVRACRAAVERLSNKDRSMLAEPIALDLVAYFGTPKADRWHKAHTAKPDGDNVLKLWQDCAELAGLLPKGDARVVDARVRKLWGPNGCAVLVLTAATAADVEDADDLGASELL